MKNNKKENISNHYEGFTLSYGGVKRENGDKMIKSLITDHKTLTLKDLSYVKVTNLQYDTELYLEGYDYVLKNRTGLKTKINPNDLVTEWVGVGLTENGVEKNSLKEWLGRFCGGLDYLNEDIEMVSPMEVVDFDYEIIPFDEIVKDFPLLKEKN